MGTATKPILESHPARVLVAEGDKISLNHVRTLLTKSGYDVTVARDGLHALELLESKNPPTLAVLDWTMPGLNGIEVCRRLRSADRPRSTHVILLTPWNQQNERVEALEAGADDCLHKPVDVRELRIRLQIGAQIILERALMESEARFRTAFECAGIGMAVLKTSGEFLQVSHALCELLGYTSKELLGMSLHAVVSHVEAPAPEELLQQLLANGMRSSEFERDFVTKSGSAVCTSSTASVVLDSDERPTCFVLQVQDITERKAAAEALRRSEGQLRQAQKLEAIGQLAAGIAHEINTPTQYVSDNVTFLKDSWGPGAEFLNFCNLMRAEAVGGSVSPQSLTKFNQLYEKADLNYLLKEIPRAIDQSLDGLKRIAKIVRGMKDFSHPGSKEKRAVNLNQAIDSTITVARHEWKYCAELVTAFDPALPLVSCLAGEFNQVMLNLIINAAHAIGSTLGENSSEKGTITITTRRQSNWAEITVGDTGCGIPEEIRSRIFDPFFTTKEVGKGTGQGLALAHSVVVKLHQGQLWFETELGRGTKFFIRLPLEIGVAVS